MSQPPEPPLAAPGPARGGRDASAAVSALRGLLWGLLVFVLLAVGWLAVTARHGARGGDGAPPVVSQVPDFTLTNRDGRVIHRADLAGSPWIADFVFTRCGGSCPMMTTRLANLGRHLPSGVRRVSFSVDPSYDTPEVLAKYAAAYQAPPDWLFLTGSVDEIYRLSRDGFKLAVAPVAPEERAAPAAGEGGPVAGPELEPILHSTRFVLVDGEGRIRGYYDAFEDAAVSRLLSDLDRLLAGR